MMNQAEKAEMLEQLEQWNKKDEYFGFGVDAGMGCVADIQTLSLIHI